MLAVIRLLLSQSCVQGGCNNESITIFLFLVLFFPLSLSGTAMHADLLFRIDQPTPVESICSRPCSPSQAKKYVEGEGCCWTCVECIHYQVRRLPHHFFQPHKHAYNETERVEEWSQCLVFAICRRQDHDNFCVLIKFTSQLLKGERRDKLDSWSRFLFCSSQSLWKDQSWRSCKQSRHRVIQTKWTVRLFVYLRCKDYVPLALALGDTDTERDHAFNITHEDQQLNKVTPFIKKAFFFFLPVFWHRSGIRTTRLSALCATWVRCLMRAGQNVFLFRRSTYVPILVGLLEPCRSLRSEFCSQAW